MSVRTEPRDHAAASPTTSATRGATGPPEAPRQAIVLRPLDASDYETVFRAETGSLDRVVRFRNRGVLAPPEQYTASLWSNVLVHLVACDTETGSRLTLFTCYDEAPRHGTAKVAALRLGDHHVSGLAGLDLFLDHLFDTFPFRKLYVDILEWNLPQFGSLGRLGARLEGRLRAHERHGCQTVDLLIYALSRSAWSAHRARPRPSLPVDDGTGPAELRAALADVLGLPPNDDSFDRPDFFSALDSLEKLLVLEFVEHGAAREVPLDLASSWESLSDVLHAYLAVRDR